MKTPLNANCCCTLCLKTLRNQSKQRYSVDMRTDRPTPSGRNRIRDSQFLFPLLVRIVCMRSSSRRIEPYPGSTSSRRHARTFARCIHHARSRRPSELPNGSHCGSVVLIVQLLIYPADRDAVVVNRSLSLTSTWTTPAARE